VLTSQRPTIEQLFCLFKENKCSFDFNNFFRDEDSFFRFELCPISDIGGFYTTMTFPPICPGKVREIMESAIEGMDREFVQKVALVRNCLNGEEENKLPILTVTDRTGIRFILDGQKRAYCLMDSCVKQYPVIELDSAKMRVFSSDLNDIINIQRF